MMRLKVLQSKMVTKPGITDQASGRARDPGILGLVEMVRKQIISLMVLIHFMPFQSISSHPGLVPHA